MQYKVNKETMKIVCVCVCVCARVYVCVYVCVSVSKGNFIGFNFDGNRLINWNATGKDEEQFLK